MFWRANRAWLARAEAIYGVPPEIIVGIVGVETIYGQQMGQLSRHRCACHARLRLPARAQGSQRFFRDELESYLVLCAQQGTEPLTLKGSYAGAMGMPQFMPSSVLRYAIDFDGDGRIDCTMTRPT